MLIFNMISTLSFDFHYNHCLGNSEVSDDTTVMHALPQPAAETKR